MITDDLDVKAFMEAHSISAWRCDNDKVELALRRAGLRVLLVQPLEQEWHVVMVRKEPDFFYGNAETGETLRRTLSLAGIFVGGIRLKTASYRMVATFTWADGFKHLVVRYAKVKRSRLVEVREEFSPD